MNVPTLLKSAQSASVLLMMADVTMHKVQVVIITMDAYSNIFAIRLQLMDILGVVAVAICAMKVF